MTTQPLLAVRDLDITYRSARGTVRAVSQIGFEIAPGEAVGIIGESGSGKSSVAYSIVGWTPDANVTGHISLDGFDVVNARARQLQQIRGGGVSLVPQDPKKSLNPSMRVGPQVVEQLIAHNPSMTKQAARQRVLELFERVNLSTPDRIFQRFPHEISGGQQQRILIAAAISCEPKLIIMDEPTTGLDVTTSAQIIDLIGELRARSGCALLFISHDLSVVARVSDRVLVMRHGKVIESGPTLQIFDKPKDDYTRLLIQSVPDATTSKPAAPEQTLPPVLRADAVVKRYGEGLFSGKHGIVAVDKIGFTLGEGQTLSVVGESGSGKTTLARMIAGLSQASEGSIYLYEKLLSNLPRKRSRENRQAIQLIFQNPDASLNPRHTIAQILKRPMTLYRSCPADAMDARVAELLTAVQLPADYAGRYSGQLSGGEKQRVAIARAFAAKPRVIVCDEPTSALDLSVQAAVLQLLLRLQREENVSYLFITHDLNVVRALGGSVVVMRNGICVESGRVSEIFDNPHEDYTRQLLSAAPALSDVIRDIAAKADLTTH